MVKEYDEAVHCRPVNLTSMQSESEVTQSCLTLCNPMDCLQRSSIHGIFQARVCRVHHAKCQAGESQAGINTARRNINNLRYADDTTLMVENEEELKSL